MTSYRNVQEGDIEARETLSGHSICRDEGKRVEFTVNNGKPIEIVEEFEYTWEEL
jgi:hypothetical protein